MTGALWIPLIWTFIGMSRFVTAWLDMFGIHVGGVSVQEGSPVDALGTLILIVAALRVLVRRRLLFRRPDRQRGGMASMVYAGKMIKELDLSGDYTLYVVGSVQEEDCDGLSWLYILREDGVRPDCVVITEPSNLGIYRGHRGRMEIEVHLRGRSCHASAPERGDNPIYKMARLVAEVEKLNERLRSDPFLAKVRSR